MENMAYFEEGYDDENPADKIEFFNMLPLKTKSRFLEELAHAKKDKD